MEVARDGSFMLTIGSGELARGLRPTSRSPRNEKFLTKCIGAVGIDEVLSALNNIGLYRVDTGVIADGFPYPQMFVFTNVILFCGLTAIYELVAGALVMRVGALTSGNLWTAIEAWDFIYMSNGKVAILRDPNSKIFYVTFSQPAAEALCNYNMQVFAGAPIESWPV